MYTNYEQQRLDDHHPVIAEDINVHHDSSIEHYSVLNLF
jgi:hypothetical protein